MLLALRSIFTNPNPYKPQVPGITHLYLVDRSKHDALCNIRIPRCFQLRGDQGGCASMDFEQETSSLRYCIAPLSVLWKESIYVEFYDLY
uniref:Uncharacterized protein n=1 Tax=Lactuca sativa TaxID=4236 RepID=A0A9R1WPG6_LACSA|nr:hypothetical protein LSAT_V11C100049000 [Lactuca sativa]